MLKFKTKNNIKLALFAAIILAVSCSKKEKIYVDKEYVKPKIVKEASSDFQSPEESLSSFYLPEGYKIELVASEPMIDEPVTIAWDGDGKLYVAEMNTYMQDIDGTGTKRSISKIKQLIDSDGDGKMDESTVFIDSLLLPRMILPLGDGELVVNETDSYDLWLYKDTDKDGVADTKKRVYGSGARRGGNLEHQQSGLLWNLDNYVYTTYNPVRFKFKKDTVISEKISDMPRGQWGLTQDDMGIMYYSAAGGENPAYGFGQPAQYGDFSPKERLEEGFNVTWPIVGTPDVQGGTKRLKKDGTLNHFTGVAGQEIYRGHKLPSIMYGDLFIPEPVGRFIRRAKVTNDNGLKVLKNAYYQTEFLGSTDLNFRPVWSQTGPDGTLYVVDMYRGIIQESNWTREGSSIRPVIKRKKLDKNIGKGRIYRIVHEDFTPDKKPALLNKSAKELIEFLGHRNGWYRNTAQKLIILKEDLSVIPALKELSRNNKGGIFEKWFGDDSNKDYGLERIHSLWTLEGLGEVDKELLKEKFSDEDSRVRVTAIRLSERFIKNGETDLFKHYEVLAEDISIEVVNQLALSLRYNDTKQSTSLLKRIQLKYKDNTSIAHSTKESLKKDDEVLIALKTRIKDRAGKKSILRGYEIYNQLCITCHAQNLKGMPNEDGSLIAPTLIGSKRVIGDKTKLVKLVLNGLIGEVDGVDYGVMMPLKDNENQWIADVLSYVRAMNDEDIVNKGGVEKTRRQNKRKDYWTLKELEKSK